MRFNNKKETYTTVIMNAAYLIKRFPWLFNKTSLIIIKAIFVFLYTNKHMMQTMLSIASISIPCLHVQCNAICRSKGLTILPMDGLIFRSDKYT